jgi:GIY-YIG catalytic domain
MDNDSNDEQNRKGSIYCIENKINGKKYIGQTIRDPQVRFKEHIASSKQEDPGCRAIALAIRRYGSEQFNFVVIQTCESADLDKFECEQISKHNSMAVSGHGYNLYPGGKRTYTGHNGSARDKISAGQRKHFDGIHDLPRYIQYVPPGKHGEGYIVSVPKVKFVHFTASVMAMDEKFDFAVRYLTSEEDREKIFAEYVSLKNQRRVDDIEKNVVIDGQTYLLPAHFMWCPGEQMFLVRRPGKKAKQFGDKRMSIAKNYDRARKYYYDEK